MENQDLLIIKFLSNECTADEKEELERWLHADVNHVLYFKKAEKIWEYGEIKADNFTPDIQSALKDIHKKIEHPTKNISLRPDFFHYAKRVAAVFIIAVCVGLATYAVYKRNFTLSLIEFRTDKEKKEILLSDGTKVWLNKNSVIRYPKEFQKDIREVEVEGEAYFDVTKNPQKPFVIHSQNSVIRVVGTSFNVHAFPAENEIIVTVTSGKVAFYEQSNEAGKIYLVKGDRGILSKDIHTVIKEKNTDMNFISWQTGKVIFSDTPLAEAVEVLSRHYNKSIRVTGDVASCRFTGTFSNQSLEDVLEELGALLNIEIKNKNSFLTITGKGC